MPMSTTKKNLIAEIAFARDVLAELRGEDLRPPLNRNADLYEMNCIELEEMLAHLHSLIGSETLKACQDR